MRVAIVHDYLNQFGGAERVVGFFLRIFPNTPVYTSLYFPESTFDFFKKIKVYTSFIQKIPNVNKNFKKFFLLYPYAFKRLKLDGYDIVISSSSAFAKYINVRKPSIHICYCYTPTRFLWEADKYMEGEKINRTFQYFLRPLISYLRKLDLEASKKPHYFISISNNVREKIKKIYNRDSIVIYPPIEVNKFKFSNLKENFYLVVSRLKGYKRVDLVVKAFNLIKKNLIIVGSGEDEGNLKKIANSNVKFLGKVNESELIDLYSRAKALIFPGEEDYGLAPIEAQASGAPVIAFGKGGAVETVKNEETGLFFYHQDTESLIEAITKFEKNPIDYFKCRENAYLFDFKFFKRRIINFINKIIK